MQFYAETPDGKFACPAITLQAYRAEGKMRTLPELVPEVDYLLAILGRLRITAIPSLRSALT
jgi:hypothetical protein